MRTALLGNSWASSDVKNLPFVTYESVMVHMKSKKREKKNLLRQQTLFIYKVSLKKRI